MDASSEPAAKLRAAVAAFVGKPFAVVDGGLFEDLPKVFKHERLFARSLFLDQADVEKSRRPARGCSSSTRRQTRPTGF